MDKGKKPIVDTTPSEQPDKNTNKGKKITEPNSKEWTEKKNLEQPSVAIEVPKCNSFQVLEEEEEDIDEQLQLAVVIVEPETGEVQPLASVVEKAHVDTIQALNDKDSSTTMVDNENGIEIAVVLNSPMGLQGMPPVPDKVSEPIKDIPTHRLIDEVVETVLKI
ncbi:hypothetical protein FRX31_024779, partial [Thalictrum thalictroides]